jgi:hypothetical protein
MKLKAKDIRDIFAGLTLLSREPIANHFLNFRMTNALVGLKPTLDTFIQTENAILKEYALVDESGEVKRDEKDFPIWPSKGAEEQAVAILTKILDEEFEVPGTVKPLSWDLLERTKCVFTNKDGARTTEPLVVSVQVQLLLQKFIEGEPVDLT